MMLGFLVRLCELSSETASGPVLQSQQIFPELGDEQDSMAREGLGKALRIQAKMPGQCTGDSDTEPKKRLNNVLLECPVNFAPVIPPAQQLRSPTTARKKEENGREPILSSTDVLTVSS